MVPWLCFGMCSLSQCDARFRNIALLFPLGQLVTVWHYIYILAYGLVWMELVLSMICWHLWLCSGHVLLSNLGFPKSSGSQFLYWYLLYCSWCCCYWVYTLLSHSNSLLVYCFNCCPLLYWHVYTYEYSFYTSIRCIHLLQSTPE